MKMAKRERRRVGYCILGLGRLVGWDGWEVLDGQDDSRYNGMIVV